METFVSLLNVAIQGDVLLFLEFPFLHTTKLVLKQVGRSRLRGVAAQPKLLAALVFYTRFDTL